MLKPMIQLYPVLPTKDEEERERLRPLGRNRKIYHEVLKGWHDIIRAADDMGIWGAATIEHHFWSEGYEVGPSPGTLDAYWAAITKNIRVGQLGYVMSTQNPIRVAEETAIIDHLSGGRSFVGFARGYQSRWTNVVGQHLGARATRSPNAAIYNPATQGVGFSTATKDQVHLDDDARNRANFEEGIDIVIKSWTQESYKHSGLNWKIPYPEGKGVDDWQLAHQGITQRLAPPARSAPTTPCRKSRSARHPTRIRIRPCSFRALAARRQSNTVRSVASSRCISPISERQHRSPTAITTSPRRPATTGNRGRTSASYAGCRSARPRMMRVTA